MFQMILAAWLLLPVLGSMGAALAAASAAVLGGWLSSFLVPALRPCAAAQTIGLLVLFSPRKWAGCIKLLS